MTLKTGIVITLEELEELADHKKLTLTYYLADNTLEVNISLSYECIHFIKQENIL